MKKVVQSTKQLEKIKSFSKYDDLFSFMQSNIHKLSRTSKSIGMNRLASLWKLEHKKE